MMSVSYDKLWKLLVDKKMSKADLRRATGISPNTMTKLTRNEGGSFSVLDRICDALSADYGEIITYVPNEKSR